MTNIEDAGIWKTTLAPQSDAHEANRERLRQAFFTFREHVAQLVQTIPRDVVGLTVHDISHLDALWGMADILTGGTYPLNPAEAFVFGGAILLHDSAMTVCAYAGGIEEIKQTPEYSDAFAHFQSKLGISTSTSPDESDRNVHALALGDTLRLKHASKAEELASQLGTTQYLESTSS